MEVCQLVGSFMSNPHLITLCWIHTCRFFHKNLTSFFWCQFFCRLHVCQLLSWSIFFPPHDLTFICLAQTLEFWLKIHYQHLFKSFLSAPFKLLRVVLNRHSTRQWNENWIFQLFVLRASKPWELMKYLVEGRLYP